MNTGLSGKSERAQPASPPSAQADVAAVLCEHPAVCDAVACRRSKPGDEGMVAFVLANESYLDDVMGRKDAASSQVRRWRKTYDLTQLAKTASASPLAFNIAGWNSSYTRQPLAPEDMQEWVQTTVDRISTLAPSEVLEIGCGTGLLLLRLAPACKRYVAVDFAPAVLMRLREQLAQTGDLREKVELLERSADNFEGLVENSFSTVIVNSVAQHFPSQAYLNRVIENAIRVVRPGGHVFIGDQRNLLLLEAYAASVEAFQATPEVSVQELRNRIDRRIQQEQQLVLSPSYFLLLKQRFPEISRIEIHPRRGTRDNEMTRFRFDAILWVKTESPPPAGIPFFDPPGEGWSLNDMRSRLAEQKSDAVGFARIRNPRVDGDLRLLVRLASADPQQLLAAMREELARSEARGIHPEEIVRLAAETGYNVAISWTACYPDGSYDAAFIRQDSPKSSAFPSVNWPQPTSAAFVYCTNAPGQAEIRQRLVDELLSHCRTRLQGKPVPASLRLVDALPRGADGRVDCQALLSATR